MQFAIVKSFQDINQPIYDFFEKLDTEFVPPIKKRMPIENYIKNIFDYNGQLIICRHENIIAGIIGIELNHPLWKFYIQYIAVDKEYRNQKIADRLLECAYVIFREHSANRITIRTWSSNAVSNTLLRSHGFLHFKTISDDRLEGVHSYYYSKYLMDFGVEKKIQSLCIIGGMGTYSTSNFIDTICKIPRTISEEQNLIPFILVNEPTIPDRTTFIVNKNEHDIINAIDNAINKISNIGNSHLLVLCFTIHPFLNQLKNKPLELVDLVSFTKKLIHQKNKKWLLACTVGTYLLNTFEQEDILIPDEQHRQDIHDIIYRIKNGIEIEYQKNRLINIVKYNDCNGIILGCTDLHKIFGFNLQEDEIEIIDPLLELSFHIHTKRL